MMQAACLNCQGLMLSSSTPGRSPRRHATSDRGEKLASHWPIGVFQRFGALDELGKFFSVRKERKASWKDGLCPQ
jgi:hypothetical protein